MADITWGGVLATAGDVVFGGGKEGYFVALDATSGAELWKMAVGGQVNAGAMSYAVNGKQYVAIAAGQFAVRVRATLSRAKPLGPAALRNRPRGLQPR